MGGKIGTQGHRLESAVLCKSLNPSWSSAIGRGTEISSSLVLRFVSIPQTMEG